MATARITTAQFETGVVVKIDERTEIVVVPPPLFVTLGGMLFDTNKSFLLPVARDKLAILQDVYDVRDTNELLIVGHTDTSGDPTVNDPLSLERAQKLVAFVKDDAAPWLEMFNSSVPSKRRWGSHEDFLMIAAVLGDSAGSTIEAYQLNHNARVESAEKSRDPLTADGLIGPNTRRELILDYMDRDGTSLGNGEFQINVTAHGCGENFPLNEAGDDLDAAPAPNATDEKDRRVEFFFFPASTGILPPPPGSNSAAGSTEYPEGRERAEIIPTTGVEGLSGRRAHFSFLLMAEDGTPLANKAVTLTGENGEVDSLNTDGDGLLEKEDVNPGDYVMVVSDVTSTIPALNPDASRVTWLVRPGIEKL